MPDSREMVEAKPKEIVRITFNINVNFASGLFVGICNGIFFHPIDRALYLRGTQPLRERKQLFAREYWQNPFLGLRNTFFQRVLSNSVYFTLQGELNTHWYPILRNDYQFGEKSSKLVVGAATGAMTGVVSNASYAIKFYTFNKGSGTPLENAIEMWKKGGAHPFFKGIYAGTMRDTKFGICYEVNNVILDQVFTNIIPDENTKVKTAVYFTTRFFSASLATALSSPWNYARNMQFSTPPHERQSRTIDLWHDAWNECNRTIRESKCNSFFPRLRFFQEKFMINAGTLRAGAGMAAGQLGFSLFKKHLEKLDEAKQESFTPKTK